MFELHIRNISLPHQVQCVYFENQHPALCVTSEEKVLDAIIMWGANKDDIYGWEDANRRVRTEGASLFQNRMEDLKLLLPLVRFPLIPLPVLQMVSQRSLTLPQSDGMTFVVLYRTCLVLYQACFLPREVHEVDMWVHSVFLH